MGKVGRQSAVKRQPCLFWSGENTCSWGQHLSIATRQAITVIIVLSYELAQVEATDLGSAKLFQRFGLEELPSYVLFRDRKVRSVSSQCKAQCLQWLLAVDKAS